MSEIKLFPDDNAFDTTGPPASPVAVQRTSAPQDTIIEPAAATRGRRPSCAAVAHTSRHRGMPSPSPSRRQPPSPASSYASALSSAPAAEKWTVTGLRQALISSGVNVPRRSVKADLLALYTSLQTGAPPSSTPPSKAADKASQGRSIPYSRPELTTTPSKMGFRPLGCSKKPSASPGRAPDAASPRPPPPSTEPLAHPIAANMSEIELFPDDNAFDTTGPPSSPVAVQRTSAPQDTIIEPAAATRGRRPSCAAVAHTSRHRGMPSPSPSRRQPPSPASSYASALSSAPAAEKWTVTGLRQALISAGANVPRRSVKADLLALYTSLQTGAPPSSTPPSKAADKASQGRSIPYSRPELTTTPSKMGFRPLGCSKKPSASPGRAPDAASPRPPPPSTERQLDEMPAPVSTSRRVSWGAA
ncbi:uncharacterized protein DKFZp434B061-like [Sinocyclocheilus rhinocerous]|uniref:uncharacterized protein DKFZp434B061-like n=1 Tax=Sinocyclocheilus rhinocerous TaxID=307959 RepID=UPI0007BA8708|nr:PREDICTED: uncharacterized protein DKFZp434B061-like [Sinocyclocheilus rhinocerous]